MPEETEEVAVVEETAETVEEQPTAPVVNEEVNIDELPENIREYIGELREEAKDRRKTHEPYKEAFQHYNEAERDYLLKLVNAVATDQEVGARAMKQLAEHLLGETDEQPEAKTVSNDQLTLDIPEEEELISASEIDTIVQEQIRKQDMIKDVHEKSRALGFEPNTPECKVMWDIALTPALNGDLEKAAELARAYLGDGAPPDPNAEVEEAPAKEFPTSATISGSGAITADMEQQEIPSIKSDAMRDKVLARLHAQIGE